MCSLSNRFDDEEGGHIPNLVAQPQAERRLIEIGHSAPPKRPGGVFV
jgi:hypothetical protein